MTSDTFEYAIKKDVRNNPIVREVDSRAHREMWRSVAVGVFLVVVLLFSAWQHFELLRHGYRLEQMQKALRPKRTSTATCGSRSRRCAPPERIECHRRSSPAHGRARPGGAS